MIKKTLAITLTMLIVLSFSAFAAAEPSEWAKAEINPTYPEMFASMGIEVDYQRPITRAEFAMLAFSVYRDINGGLPNIETKEVFEDIGAEMVDTIIPMAAALGIVKGVSNTHFMPKNPITRQEICTMLSRISEKLDKAYNEKLSISTASGTLAKFVDTSLVSDWAREPMSFCVYDNIMKGVSDTQLAPLDNVTVEQAMVLCGRMASK